MKGKAGGKGSSGSGLFLMEMIVVVFFFVICASQCILAFATSERMSRQGQDLNQAVTMAESIVEVWKTEGVDGLVNRLGFSKWRLPQGDERVIYTALLNDAWEPEGFTNGHPLQILIVDVPEGDPSFDEMQHSSRMAQVEIFEDEDGLSSIIVTMNNQSEAPEISYRGEAAQLLSDSGGHVVFVLEAKKYNRPEE
ncbi:MAG: hypothetical protein HFG54_01985 [Lachnospiraceae bacterium]|jgi:hypothetical protein|nr:hypothetical protein [Lachnospiraceae bacterium]